MARVAAVKGEATRTSILDAARSVLRERGYASFSTREVAAVAGVPLSQIHYHFGSKQGMVLALFESINAQLLDRQQAMFADRGLSLSERWDLACDYLDDDLATGYVRVLQELLAVGWTNPEIGQVVRDGVMSRIELLTDLARKAQDTYGSLGPFTPEDIAALVGAAFIGMEAYLLLGLEEQGLPLRRSLRRFGEVIRVLEEQGNQGR